MTTEQLRTVEDRGLPASGHGFYDKPRQAEVMKHGFTAVNSLSSPPVPFLSEEGVRQHYLPFRETSQIQSPNTGPMRSPSAVLKAVETGHVSKDRREEPTNGSPRRRRQKSDIESGAMPDTHQPNSTPTHPKKRRRETPNSGDGDGSAGGTGQPLQRQQHSGADDPNQSSTMQLDRHHREASPSEQEWDGHQHADGEEDAALRGALTKEVRSAESQRHDHQHLEGNDEARRRDAISIESESSESRQSDNRVATPEGDPSRKKQQDQEKDRVLIARVEAEKGRRKRIFSNRTKTGCGTCRRRKKKCDENKPACDNCTRGGFTCTGYAPKTDWSKGPAPRTQPVQIQAKGGYADPGGYNTTVYSRGDSTRAYANMTENEQRQTDLRASWSRSKEHPDIPYGTPSHPVFTRSSHPGQSSIEDSRAAVAAAATAQLALQHSSEYPRPSNSQLDSERRRMVAGQEFLRFCTQLMDDRDKCTTALWRFNNAGSPNQGVMGVLTRDDRARLFRAIMEPEHLRNPDSSDCPFGRVGESVYVQAPFHCDYGYNIHIGNEVDIGPNCTINDPCTVTIGDRSILSQNVRICGIRMNEDYRRRNGSQGRVAVGMPVTIRNDVFIGCNVTIMPGVIVGEESYVTEDSLVAVNVPPRTLVSGRPAQIVHGIDLRSSREIHPPTGPPKDLARWTPRPPEPGRQRDYSGQMEVD